MTWNDLDQKIPDCTLGRLMDYVEEDTGKFPGWEEEVPGYIVEIING